MGTDLTRRFAVTVTDKFKLFLFATGRNCRAIRNSPSLRSSPLHDAGSERSLSDDISAEQPHWPQERGSLHVFRAKFDFELH
jgi:hypothetical protein